MAKVKPKRISAGVAKKDTASSEVRYFGWACKGWRRSFHYAGMYKRQFLNFPHVRDRKGKSGKKWEEYWDTKIEVIIRPVQPRSKK